MGDLLKGIPAAAREQVELLAKDNADLRRKLGEAQERFQQQAYETTKAVCEKEAAEARLPMMLLGRGRGK
jgi:uncharacterized protein (UPF0216 family)